MAEKKVLEGKGAIVTGSGRGIGRAHALLLAEYGAKVVVNDPGVARDGTGADKAVADQVVDEIKREDGEAMANYDSVATSEGAANIVKTALDNFGRLDILVNNAGVLRERMLFNMADEEWDAVVKTHLYGTFYMTREACKIFRQQRSGKIINTSSTAGLGGTGQMNYTASKEGIIGLTRGVAREMQRYGVCVNAIRPAAYSRMTASDEMKQAFVKRGGTEQEWEERTKRMAEQWAPEGNSPIVVFLASEAADNVNGCVFSVRKGYVGIYKDPPYVESSLWKEENWTPDELIEIMPNTLTKDKVRELPAITGA